MSAFIIEGQYDGKNPKTCGVTICCSCDHTFKAKMYDIRVGLNIGLLIVG